MSSDPVQKTYLEGNRERTFLIALAAIQFTHITDFVIMMPLGPQFMRVFKITPSEFSLVVSAYTVSAAFSSLLAAAFMDRFNRRKLFMFLYSGFVVGTGVCGLCNDFYHLLIARVVAGAFGGTVSSLSFTLVGDFIRPERRGRGMGMLMAAFSVATVVGLPLGLAIAAHYGWHWVFLGLASLGVLYWVLAFIIIPSYKPPQAASPWGELKQILSKPNCQKGLGFASTVVAASFLIVPFLSPSLVSNVGLREEDLSFVYLTGGLCTFFTSQLIGRASDRWGHRKVFMILAVISMVPIIIMTNLPPLPLALVLVCSATFMIFVSGRMIPTMAMVAGLVPSSQRGSYMALISFMQQLTMGVATFISGRIVSVNANGKLLHYSRSGIAAIGVTLVALYLARGFKPQTAATSPAP